MSEEIAEFEKWVDKEKGKGRIFVSPPKAENIPFRDEWEAAVAVEPREPFYERKLRGYSIKDAEGNEKSLFPERLDTEHLLVGTVKQWANVRETPEEDIDGED